MAGAQAIEQLDLSGAIVVVRRGAERGAFLDFVDYPMNNRWWLEDEFEKVRGFATEEEKRNRLVQIATWETSSQCRPSTSKIANWY